VRQSSTLALMLFPDAQAQRYLEPEEFKLASQRKNEEDQAQIAEAARIRGHKNGVSETPVQAIEFKL